MFKNLALNTFFKKYLENANKEEIRIVPVTIVFCSSLILLKCIQYSTWFSSVL